MLCIVDFHVTMMWSTIKFQILVGKYHNNPVDYGVVQISYLITMLRWCLCCKIDFPTEMTGDI